MQPRNARRFEARFHRRLASGPLKGLAWKLILVIFVLGLIGLIKLLAYGLPSSRKASSAAASRIRTVIVVAEHETVTSEAVRTRLCRPWVICRNGKDHIDVAVLKQGRIPTHPMKAVVETDTDCAADIYGDSHCTDILRLSDGHEIEVRHDHNMNIYPCLRSGETVEVEGQPFTRPRSHGE